MKSPFLMIDRRMQDNRINNKVISSITLVERPQGVPIVDLSEPQARGYLSQEQALKLKALPLRIEYQGHERVLLVAVTAENDHELKTKLHFATGLVIRCLLADEAEILPAIGKAYQGDNSILIESISQLKDYQKQRQAQENTENLYAAEGNEVTRFISRLIEYAAAHDASDIHLTPQQEGVFVKMRINDQLLDHAEPLINLEIFRQIVARIKILAELDTTNRSLPQDGRFSYPLSNSAIEVRVSSLPTIYGENLVLRLFAGGRIRALENLGYHERVLRSIAHFIAGSSGLMLIGGPTGSGKTSALYSVVSEMKSRNFVVTTIEDPIEIILKGVVQSSISEAAGFDYQRALKAVLRQDPDAILIGELRDAGAVCSAIDAALTGHHVLSTVHGKRVIDVIRRLESFGAEKLSLFSVLSLILTQRLVPRLCQHCKTFDLRSANAIGCDVYQRVGCVKCSHEGYFGKKIIAEALLFDDEVRERLSSLPQLTGRHLKELAGTRFLTLQDQSLAALEQGEISYQQYLQIC